MVLVQNDPFFPSFYFRQYRQRNVFYDILERKYKKSKNYDFSKGVNPWFWSKNGRFSNFTFVANIGHENVLYDILQQKNAFLGYKSKKLKK